MTTFIDAVYHDGVFRPTTRPDLPDGTAVRLTVEPASIAGPSLRDSRQFYEQLKAIAEMPEESGGDPTVTGRDHDRVLYGSPGGVR